MALPIVILNVVSVVCFGFALIVSLKAPRHLPARLFLGLSAAVYVFVGISNVLQHSGITDMLDSYEDYAEFLFLPFAVFFILSLGTYQEQQRRIQAEELYRSVTDDVLDQSIVGMLILDGSFQIVWANQTVEQFFGFDRGEILGQDMRQLVRDRMKDSFEQPDVFVREIFSTYEQEGHSARFECHVLGGAGRVERWLEHRSQPIHSGPYAGGRAELYYDVTDRKRAEEERATLEAQVFHSQKLESLGVLAGGIAHDFNNLLVAILGNADLALMDMSSDSPERAGVEEIKRAAQRASELTNQMLAYSGKGRFVTETVNLNDVVKEMGHLLNVSVSKKATLEYDLAEDLPPVDVDTSQIRQVVMNLITNASDAIGERSGTIRLQTRRVWAGREFLSQAYIGKDLPEGRYVSMEVSDTGCGMSPETAAKIFEPFSARNLPGAAWVWRRHWGSCGAIAARSGCSANWVKARSSRCCCLSAKHQADQPSKRTAKPRGTGKEAARF